MRKSLSHGLVVIAGVLSVPTMTTTPRWEPPLSSLIQPTDPRLGRLRHFFAASAAPAEEVAHIFLQVADSYGLDWRLLPSISLIESGGGKTARNNNLFGWNAGRAEYPSLTAAIQAVAWCLTNSNLYRDKSLDEILSTYNPDAEYGRKVKSIMRRISPAEVLLSRPAS